MTDQSQYNADELTAPEWLSTEFLEVVLRNCEQVQNVKVTKYKITPGTAKSDHYGSIMFRAHVHYVLSDKKEQHFRAMIIKSMPQQEGQKKELLGTLQLFETEIRMYSETLPKIHKILQNYGDRTELSARVLYHALEPRKLIVFEDLLPLGYKTIAQRTCNMTEVRAAFLKLAKLHAVSYKLAQDGDESIKSYRHCFFNTIDVHEFCMTKNAMTIFKELLSEHEDLREYVPHLECVEFDYLTKSVDTINLCHTDIPAPRGIYVLNHGDFHMKNMLVNYEDNKLKDLMLVDYQMSIFGSAVIDIIYSTTMLLNAEMRLKHRDELIHYYFSNFQNTLKLIEFQGTIPKMQDFQDELLKHKHFEIFMIVCFLFATYFFSDTDGDLQQVVENIEYRKQIWKNPELLQELRQLLPILLHRGYFEK